MNTLLLAMITGHLTNMQRAIDISSDITKNELKELLVDLVYIISLSEDKELHARYQELINEKFDEIGA